MNQENIPWKFKPKFTPELVALIQQMPDKALPHFLSWGYLFECQPELFKFLKQNASFRYSQKVNIWHDPRQKITPFKLELPEDIPLLSILAPALVQLFVELDNRFDIFGENNLQNWSLQILLNEYGLEINQLRDIAESDIYEPNARSGALSLYWLLWNEIDMENHDRDQAKLNLNKEKKLYAELVNKVNEEWLTLALVRGVLAGNSETNHDAVVFVSYLMELCLDGHGPRDALIELLGNWRERSTAPVQSNQVLDKWLGYGFQTPPYARY